MIVVTGATGQLGRLVIAALLKTVPAANIVAAVRSPEKASDLAALGVQVRRADYSDAASLDAALQGAEKILLISSNEIGQRLTQHRAVIDAAKRANVKLLAYELTDHGYEVVTACDGLRALEVAGSERPDVILVPYPGHVDVPFIAPVARARRIPLLFDTFISLYDTIVEDRGLRRPTSAIGRATHAADTVACRLANLVLCDTPAHADYFAAASGVDRNRFRT